MNSQKRHANFEYDFTRVACKFTALLKKSHSLLDDPRTGKLSITKEENMKVGWHIMLASVQSQR